MDAELTCQLNVYQLEWFYIDSKIGRVQLDCQPAEKAVGNEIGTPGSQNYIIKNKLPVKENDHPKKHD